MRLIVLLETRELARCMLFALNGRASVACTMRELEPLLVCCANSMPLADFVAFAIALELTSMSLFRREMRNPVSFLGIVQKVWFVCFLWGFGTAVGELPPYFIARTAAKAGKRVSEISEVEALEHSGGRC